MVGEHKPPSESELPGLPGYHPYNAQPWLVSIASGATAMGVVSVVLRLLGRRINGQPLWWDDWMILFSGAWSLVALGLLFDMRTCGLGLHADVVDPDRVVMVLKRLVAAETLYAWSLGWTKLSVLLMYYRVFRVKHFKVTAYAIGSLVMAWCICITFLFIFTCVPVEKLWYTDLPGHCISQTGTWVSNTTSTIVTDLMILLLPAPHIWWLQARKPVKIGLCLSFGLGAFVVFASSYRVKVLLTYTSSDPTYTLTPTVGWTAIEISAGIVSANLPTMLPVVALVGRWLGITRFIHTLASSHGTSNGHYGTRKGNAVDGNDAIRSFCTVQAGLDQERKANRFAPQGSTPSIFIYEQRSWEAEDGYVTEGDYDIRGPADNKSGESILLQEIPPEESKPHEPHRPS